MASLLSRFILYSVFLFSSCFHLFKALLSFLVNLAFSFYVQSRVASFQTFLHIDRMQFSFDLALIYLSFDCTPGKYKQIQILLHSSKSHKYFQLFFFHIRSQVFVVSHCRKIYIHLFYMHFFVYLMYTHILPHTVHFLLFTYLLYTFPH